MFGSIPILPSMDDCRVEGNSVIHTESNKNRSIIEFDPIITSGVAHFEAMFKNHEKVYFDIGVANAAVSFERNSRSSGTKGQSVYLNSGTGNIENLINNHEVSGNASFKCGQRVAAEVNMNYKILRFFVDGIEQPNYVVNIPPAIRFFAFLWQEGSSFEVTQFINIPSTSSSASGVEGSRSWEWGKEWVVDKVRQPRVPPYQTIPPDYMNVVPPPFILPPYIQPHMQSSTQVPGPPIGNWQQPSGSRDSQSPPPRSPCTIPRSPSPSFYGIPSLYVQPPMPRQMVML